MRRVRIWQGGREVGLDEVNLPLVVGRPRSPLEVEIGFGKGRYLLAQAERHPTRRYLGIESARAYWRIAKRRAERRGLSNAILVCGEALYAAAVCLAPECAQAVHVYFPDPWPKSRHQKRRLVDFGTADVFLELLAPGGRLYFATDHLEYALSVAQVLERHTAVSVEELRGAWPEGPRTNYEVKYMAEGRPIVRLVATRRQQTRLPMLQPEAVTSVAVGVSSSRRVE